MMPVRIRATLCVTASALLWLGGAPAVLGQDLEPRSFNNLPTGQTFFGAVYARSEGDVSPTPSSPIRDLELTIDGIAVAMSHTFALAGASAKVDLIASRLCFDGSATFDGQKIEGQRCEYGDPFAKLTWNFYGAPALTLAEFGEWQPGLVAGASLKVVAPIGTYTSEHLINGGANRWMVQPGLGMSFPTGAFQWEAKLTANFYEDNNDFFNGIQVEQDPLYTLGGHVIYSLSKGRWLSLDANYFTGGETTKNGIKAEDRQDNSRLGITFSLPLSRHHSIKLNANTGVVTRVGNDFATYSIAWLYRM